MSLNDPQWGNRGNDNNGGRRPNQGPPTWKNCGAISTASFPACSARKGGNNGGNDGGGRPPVEFSPKFLGGGISVLVAAAGTGLAGERLLHRRRIPARARCSSAGIKSPRHRVCAGAFPIRSSRMSS